MNGIAKLVRKAPSSRELNFLRQIQTETNKKQAEIAAAAAVRDENDVASDYHSARPFESIPGPKPLPIPYIGNLWRFLPFGTYGNMDYSDVHYQLYKEYGPMVRLHGLGTLNQVVLFDPEFVEKMFRNESTWPHRQPLFSLKYYRDHVRKDFYEARKGLITSNGEEWHTFRKSTNPVMLMPKNVKAHLSSVVEVCNDFLERVRYIRKENDLMPDDFINEINRLSLETFALMTLDTRLGCLNNELESDSETMHMIMNVRQAMALMFEMDAKPSLWRLYPTKDWRNFVKSMDFVVEFTNKHIMAKWEKIKNMDANDNAENKSILESLLLSTKDPKIAIVMASDILFAAIDTTSTTMATALYLLAVNPEKQQKLFEELKRLLPKKNTTITEDILNELRYTRAVIKESMRLRPTTLGNEREAVCDMVINNYQIPKGTSLMSSHMIMCTMEKHYKNATEFIPERWLKTEIESEYSYKNTNPFTYQPFGFGPRSCIGKRFAYMEMDVVISKIIRHFNVTYEGEPMTWSTKFLTAPDKPLRFKMSERSE